MPLKQLAVLEDGPVEYALAGAGEPAIVLLNGGGGPIEGWYRIFPDLSARTRVLAYNRRGIGRSARPVRPQTSDRIVQELRALLPRLGLAPPWLVVGHSLGGLHANVFARTFPGEVCGVVLIEATAPEDPVAMSRHATLFQKGLQRLVDAILPRDPFDEAVQAEASAASVEGSGVFPAVPLVVISGASPSHIRRMPSAAWQARQAGQDALVRLSPMGRQVHALGSGHFPQMSEPRLVLSAICAMIDEVRQRSQP